RIASPPRYIRSPQCVHRTSTGNTGTARRTCTARISEWNVNPERQPNALRNSRLGNHLPSMPQRIKIQPDQPLTYGHRDAGLGRGLTNRGKHIALPASDIQDASALSSVPDAQQGKDHFAAVILGRILLGALVVFLPVLIPVVLLRWRGCHNRPALMSGSMASI